MSVETARRRRDEMSDDPGVDMCERCQGSGTIGCSTSYPCSYIGPGPVPDDAANVYEATCDRCGGVGYISTEEI